MEKEVLILVSVYFGGYGDGSTGLYINGELIREGDEYHDKIDQVIEGFTECLDFLKVEYEYSTKMASEDLVTKITEEGEDIPSRLSEVTFGEY